MLLYLLTCSMGKDLYRITTGGAPVPWHFLHSSKVRKELTHFIVAEIDSDFCSYRKDKLFGVNNTKKTYKTAISLLIVLVKHHSNKKAAKLVELWMSLGIFKRKILLLDLLLPL